MINIIHSIKSVYFIFMLVKYNKYAYKLGIYNGEDEIIKSIRNISAYDLNFNDYWDSKVQELYNLMGFTNKLPTHNEIRKIDILIQDKKRNNADIVEVLELKKEMDLKKCALGELENQFDDDMPIIFSEDIIDNYDNYIIENKRFNMVKSLRKENRDN